MPRAALDIGLAEAAARLDWQVAHSWTQDVHDACLVGAATEQRDVAITRGHQY